MNNRIKLIISGIIFLTNSALYAENIILNDGSIVKGKIESRDNVSILITAEGTDQKQTIMVNNILKIITKPIYIEKVVIHKKDGISAEGFIVDYDDSGYTLRGNLINPEEVTILKQDVLYIDSRLNPVNIAVESTAGNILIKWSNPGVDVKGYRVYFKLKADAAYKLSGETDKKEYNITGLDNATGYEFLITSLTNDGFESLPGKAVILNTNEQTADKPESVSKQNIPGDDNSTKISGSKDSEFKVDFGYAVPTGSFADLFDSGYYGLISLISNNGHMFGLSYGIQTGFYTFSSGNHYKNFNYNDFYAIPVIIDAGYKFIFFKNLSLEPSIGLGYCFAGMDYKDQNNISVSSKEITPIIKAGLSISYLFANINVGLGVYYSDIIESDTQLNSIMLNLSAGHMF